MTKDESFLLELQQLCIKHEATLWAQEFQHPIHCKVGREEEEVSVFLGIGPVGFAIPMDEATKSFTVLDFVNQDIK